MTYTRDPVKRMMVGTVKLRELASSMQLTRTTGLELRVP